MKMIARFLAERGAKLSVRRAALLRFTLHFLFGNDLSATYQHHAFLALSRDESLTLTEAIWADDTKFWMDYRIGRLMIQGQ